MLLSIEAKLLVLLLVLALVDLPEIGIPIPCLKPKALGRREFGFEKLLLKVFSYSPKFKFFF